MGQDTPKHPENSNKKKIVKKVVVKKSVNSDGQVNPTGAKRVVKKVVKKPAEQTNSQPVNSVNPVNPVNNAEQTTEQSSEKKINYWEEIEKLAPSTPKKDETETPKKIVNITPKKQVNENTVIKSATPTEPQQIDENTVKVGKKILRKKSRLKRIFEKYGVFLILFFVISLSYLSWIHVVPAILNFKITGTDINNFLQPKIGFKIDSSNARFYTTPGFAVGIKFKNFKLVYPDGRIDDEKMLFLKARAATFEVPLIPLMLRTIKFNEFALRSVNVNLYKDKNGKFVYLEQFKNHFNPNAKKYLLEVPDIVLVSYNMPTFDSRTGQLEKKRGTQMVIQAKTIKEVLKQAPKANDIVIR